MKNAESRMQKTAARSASTLRSIATEDGQHAPGPNRKSQIANHKSSPPAWLMAVLLALVTIALYWPATGFDFVNYDDPLYVTANPQIQAGLTWEGLAWAFGRVHGEGTYWHPLTWVSHMVDCQLYGLKPWGHHLTSVLLHAANAALVFLVFRRMTGAYWRCVLLAGVFALHPVQVDSVAWVTERKNLLSAFFWLLTTWAYAGYAQGRSRNPAAGNTHHTSRFTFHASRFYLLSLCFFALGLMCKPILVTLPFVLLLLDYWPLGRMQKAEGRRQNVATADTYHAPSTKHQAPRFTFHVSLLVEKVPFFVLAAASSAITILAHRGLGMLDSASRLPWDLRLENALVSYGRYLAKAFWPCRLAVFYPLPAAWPMWEVVACGLILLAISGLALGTARTRPCLLVGWLWLLGVLVPSSGVIQAGAQAMADRFMYVPVIGVIVAAVWGIHGLAKGGRHQQVALSVAGSVVMVLCTVLTRQQLGHWKDSETLFRHAVEVTENNYVAHDNLGTVLGQRGQMDEAIRQFQEAVRLKPDHANAHCNLGIAFQKTGQTDEAIRQFQEALRLKPDHANAHCNLGIALEKKGQMDEAMRQFQEAIRLEPRHVDAHNNLGVNLGKRGQLDAAIIQLQETIRLKPDHAEAHNNLGTAFLQQGRTDEAIAQYQEALRLKPDYAEARSNLTRAQGMKSSPAAR